MSTHPAASNASNAALAFMSASLFAEFALMGHPHVSAMNGPFTHPSQVVHALHATAAATASSTAARSGSQSEPPPAPLPPTPCPPVPSGSPPVGFTPPAPCPQRLAVPAPAPPVPPAPLLAAEPGPIT